MERFATGGLSGLAEASRRMHFDVLSELEAGRTGRDQAAFDLWRHAFNHVRPDESLDMRTPAEVHQDWPGS